MTIHKDTKFVNVPVNPDHIPEDILSYIHKLNEISKNYMTHDDLYIYTLIVKAAECGFDRNEFVNSLSAVDKINLVHIFNLNGVTIKTH